MSIINKLKPLDQSSFSNEIVADTYFDENLSIGNKERTAIFRCGKCSDEFQAVVRKEKKRVDALCFLCFREKKYPNFYEKKYLMEHFKKLDSAIGVWYNKKFDHYRTSIRHNGLRIHIGNSKTREEAMYKYDHYCKEYGLDRETNEDHVIKL